MADEVGQEPAGSRTRTRRRAQCEGDGLSRQCFLGIGDRVREHQTRILLLRRSFDPPPGRCGELPAGCCWRPAEAEQTFDHDASPRLPGFAANCSLIRTFAGLAAESVFVAGRPLPGTAVFVFA